MNEQIHISCAFPQKLIKGIVRCLRGYKMKNAIILSLALVFFGAGVCEAQCDTINSSILCPVPNMSYTSCEDQYIDILLWTDSTIIDTCQVYITIDDGINPPFHLDSPSYNVNFTFLSGGDSVLVDVFGFTWHENETTRIFIDSAFTSDGCKTVFECECDFIVDLSPPYALGIHPSNGSIMDSTTITFGADVFDAGAGVAYDSAASSGWNTTTLFWLINDLPYEDSIVGGTWATRTFEPGDSIVCCLNMVDDIRFESGCTCPANISDTCWWFKINPDLNVPIKNNLPERFSLTAYPNPFNSSCEITAPAGTDVKIYDLRGNIVFTNAVGARSPRPMQKGAETVSLQNGTRTFIWTPDKSISSGVYLVKAFEQTNSVVCTKRIVYLK